MPVYRSKFDRFIVLIAVVTLSNLAVFLVPLLLDRDIPADAKVVLPVMCALVLGFFLWTALTVKYVFGPDHLMIRGGPFRSRIPYDEITKVAPLDNIFVGYRLLTAKDGIEIFYRSGLLGSVKISPREAERFLAELRRRCPRARFDPSLP